MVFTAYEESIFYLIELTPDGELVSKEEVPVNNDPNFTLWEGETTSDGGFILCGFTYPSPQYGWLIKYNKEGITCQTPSCDSLTVVTGLEEQIPKEEIHLFPNPTDASVSILTEGLQLTENIQLKILSMDGKTIYRLNWKEQLNRIDIDVSTLKVGCYFILLEDEQRKVLFREKLLILR